MQTLRLSDEWKDKHILRHDFQKSMLNPDRRGRITQAINYKNIPVGTEVVIKERE